MWFGKSIVSFDLLESKVSAKEASVYVKNLDSDSFGQTIIDLCDNTERRIKWANMPS